MNDKKDIKPDRSIYVTTIHAVILVCFPRELKDCEILKEIEEQVPNFAQGWDFCTTTSPDGTETSRLPCIKNKDFDHVLLFCGEPVILAEKEGKTDETNPNN